MRKTKEKLFKVDDVIVSFTYEGTDNEICSSLRLHDSCGSVGISPWLYRSMDSVWDKEDKARVKKVHGQIDQLIECLIQMQDQLEEVLN